MTPADLKAARLRLGFRYREAFAQAIGASRKAVESWENGWRPIPGWLPIMLGLMLIRTTIVHGDLPSSEYPPAVWERAQKIRLLLLDVDGVLTDGSLYFGPAGEAMKVFYVRDGHGIKMAQRGGIEVAFLSGRRSDAAYHRARELGVSRFHEGLRDKVAVLEEMRAALALPLEAVAAVGDELVDLPLMSRVGLAVAVADAAPEVKAAAHWVTPSPGGRGAVREVCDLLLKAQGTWEETVSPWVVSDIKK